MTAPDSFPSTAAGLAADIMQRAQDIQADVEAHDTLKGEKGSGRPYIREELRGHCSDVVALAATLRGLVELIDAAEREQIRRELIAGHPSVDAVLAELAASGEQVKR